MPRQQRAFLTDDTALILGDAGRTEGGKKIDRHRTTSCPPGPPFFGLADLNSISRSRHDACASGGKRTPMKGHKFLLWRWAAAGYRPRPLPDSHLARERPVSPRHLRFVPRPRPFRAGAALYQVVCQGVFSRWLDRRRWVFALRRPKQLGQC